MNLGSALLEPARKQLEEAGGSWLGQPSWSTLVSKLGERPAERPGLGLAKKDQFFIVNIDI